MVAWGTWPRESRVKPKHGGGISLEAESWNGDLHVGPRHPIFQRTACQHLVCRILLLGWVEANVTVPTACNAPVTVFDTVSPTPMVPDLSARHEKMTTTKASYPGAQHVPTPGCEPLIRSSENGLETHHLYNNNPQYGNNHHHQPEDRVQSQRGRLVLKLRGILSYPATCSHERQLARGPEGHSSQ